MSDRANQERDFVRFAHAAYEVAQQMLPRYSHPKSPHRFTFPQLAACVLLNLDLRVSYRDMEEWLQAHEPVRAALELRQVPDHSTLDRAHQRLIRMGVLETLQRTVAQRLGTPEQAPDATP
ncbi:MAG: hypothetical protein RMK79_08365 [Anaerolineae bacterium]|nr:hypothetical protein [Anaerolineae bacterium]